MKTTSLGLKKPEGTDPVDIQDFNDNADTIDAALNKRPEKTGDASNMTVAFTEAASLAELTSNDSMKGLFGKLKLVTKNVISLARLMGTADISKIGNGTVTGAINALNGNLTIKTYNNPGQIPGCENMAVSAYTMGSIFQAMPDNSLLQCSVWKPSWTSFSFPAGVGNYGALTIRRSTINAGSLQYHDLDNNIVYTRSKYGGVWNPSADAAPWAKLINNTWEQLISVSTQLTEADITLKNNHRLAEFNWLYVECGYGYNSYCYTLRTDRIRSLPSYRYRFPTNVYNNDTISSTYNTLQYVSETVLRVKTAGTDAGIVVYGHN